MTNLIYRGAKNAANDNTPHVSTGTLTYRGAKNEKTAAKPVKNVTPSRLVYRGTAA